jgi:hypothetical protein
LPIIDPHELPPTENGTSTKAKCSQGQWTYPIGFLVSAHNNFLHFFISFSLIQNNPYMIVRNKHILGLLDEFLLLLYHVMFLVPTKPKGPKQAEQF